MNRSLLNNSETLARVLSVISLLIVVAVLYVAREVFIPLALALLFSFLLAPVVTRFERWRFGRVPAVLTTALLTFAVVASVGYLVVGQLIDLTYKLPDYKVNISHKITSLKTVGNIPLSKATETLKQLSRELSDTTSDSDPAQTAPGLLTTKTSATRVEVVESATSRTKLARSIFGPLLGPFATVGIVVVFVLFMLIKREDLRDRIIRLTGRGQLNVTTQALDEAASKVAGYLFMQVIVNVAFGVPVGMGLYFMGVPHAFLWGLFATLLRFIPYLGVWIALCFPLALSLAVSNSWTMPLLTIALFVVTELITGNVVEPWLYGAHTGLSPVAVIIASIFWTWLWGGVGLLLAMPLTVCVAVLGRYIPSLSYLDALLGDEPTLSSEERYYQRLLAMDRHEAKHVAAEFLKGHSLPVLYSSVLVPALVTAEREGKSGTLDERRQRFIFETTREMVEELGGDVPPVTRSADAKTGESGALEIGNEKMASSVSALSTSTVFCLPAAYEADEIVGVMLAQLLEQEGCKAESLSCKTLANEMVEQVAEARCQIVCISATLPRDTVHSRYLCKLLRSKCPKLHIVVGLWDATQSEEQLTRRKERLPADKVVTTLVDALEEIRPFVGLELSQPPVVH
jgi:predicted PurR-regulated permease PerM